MAKRYAEEKHQNRILRAQAEDFDTSLKEVRKEAAQLRSQVAELKQVEARYLAYKKREPEIRHYLTSFPALAK